MIQLHLQTVQAALEEESECAASLLDVLKREYLALARRDRAALEDVIEQKQHCIAALAAAGRSREQALAAFSGVAHAVEEPPLNGLEIVPPELQALLSTLRFLAADLDRQNQVNGQIVEMRTRHCEHILAILQGRGTDPDLYHPSVKVRGASTGPIYCLAKA